MPENPLPSKPFNWAALVPILLPTLIFVIAVGVRLMGLTWGLKDDLHNQSLHPDEEVNWRYSQLIEPSHFKFTPGFYNYGTLYLTTLRIASDMTAAYGGVSDNPSTDWDYIRRCELAGRCISLVCGSLLCVVGYFATFRMTTRYGGLAAGLLLAFAPGLVVHSRFATVDVMAALFIGLAALQSLKMLYDPEPKWVREAALAGLWIGLSTGTKYTGCLAILMVVAALALRRPKGWGRLIAVSAGVALASFVIVTPGVLLDSQKFWADVKFEQLHTATGHSLVFVGTSNGFLYQLGNLFLGFGPLIVLLSLGGLVWGTWKRQQWAWVLLAFAIPYAILIGTAEVKFLRYTFPLSATLAIGAGVVVGEGHRQGRWGKALVALGILGIGGVDGGGLRGATAFSSAMASQDNREAAAQFIKSKSTSATVAGLVSDPWFWSATLYPDTAMVRMVPERVRNELMAGATNPRVVRYIPADGSERVDWDPRLLTELHPDFIVYSDFESLYIDRVSNLREIPVEFQADANRFKLFQSELQKDYEPAASFGTGATFVEDMRYVMPTVYVWRKKN